MIQQWEFICFEQDDISFKLDLLYHINTYPMKLWHSTWMFEKDILKLKDAICGKNNVVRIESLGSGDEQNNLKPKIEQKKQEDKPRT